MVAHPLKDFVVRYKSGDLIYREGDQGSEMYIVQSGAVEIARSLAGKDHVVAVMEKGDFFGEMSILEGCPRTASARAVEDSELVEITSAVFDRMIRGNIEIAVRMLRKLSSRLQEANRKVEENLGRPESSAAVPPEPERVVPVAPASKPAATVRPPVPGRVAPLPEGVLGTLVLGEGEQVFPIRADVCLIGRYDPVTGTRPEIDLTAYDTNRSVSRRHAKLVARGNDWFLSEEVGALNGTFLNGKRLTPGKSEPVRSGDTLALGMVLLKFQGRTPTS